YLFPSPPGFFVFAFVWVWFIFTRLIFLFDNAPRAGGGFSSFPGFIDRVGGPANTSRLGSEGDS
ncbi:hypothetical protein, partial [Nocardia cyriacigeorgica]|uniref:hypothetical protein n=1 Tax=Nocardia cyriacigeorgica TaxID=135487 RepID=UPI002454A530